MFSLQKMAAPWGNTYVNEFNLTVAQCIHISKHHTVPINICTHYLLMKNKTKINDKRSAVEEVVPISKAPHLPLLSTLPLVTPSSLQALRMPKNRNSFDVHSFICLCSKLSKPACQGSSRLGSVPWQDTRNVGNLITVTLPSGIFPSE